MTPRLWMGALVALALACGGEEAPPPGTPAAQQPAPGTAPGGAPAICCSDD